MQMNVFLWMLAGAILGWLGYSYMRFNEARGMVVSVIIGVVGGLVGGNVIAPMFAAATAAPGAFSTTALVFAGAGAAGFLAAGNLVYNQWGV
jgi:uncharacterized membrane protein YeaQ/YmgE (transglycosylase-associated protein family)